MVDITALSEELCRTFCNTIKVKAFNDGAIIALPMYDRDGDAFSVYLNGTTGGWRLSDIGNTLMRLSYENDVDALLKGSRGRLFEMIVAEAGAEEDDGELFLETSADRLIPSLFSFGQMMNRISDLSMWTKSRVASTFNDDLRDALRSLISPSLIAEDYVLPDMPNAENYTVDFYIDAPRPLLVFGVQNKDQARIATITLQYIQRHMPNDNFDTLVVCENADNIQKRDYTRLGDAANDVVSSLADRELFERKIKHRLRAVS